MLIIVILFFFYLSTGVVLTEISETHRRVLLEMEENVSLHISTIHKLHHTPVPRFCAAQSYKLYPDGYDDTDLFNQEVTGSDL